ncbi:MULTISPECIES: hypothetical protein [unclassified Paracoccus (in: a-proteobacteria)]|uniref:hypothetical protein n=1 Tax=unclassified Paracoccus (in: a-proteobacteria) TaxID=2688777 RepID=UPI001600D251|nr:hypothetical protein [Paracoccus sp. MC1862]MBB1490341.1 hypothetical protein [Paracoccus sp. MC1854]MBB1497183.1 hypothetical protein [Paracoccus sp. MC1862]QQO44840.1 hypothetical protein JGR78_16205 [Paracoccus sp. MC1862]
MALVPRILQTWRRPGAAVRGMAGISEAGLLALLLGTMAVYFVAQWPAHARAAALDPSVPLQARLGGALLATLFLMPLVVMTAALVVQLLLRAFGTRIEGFESRLALVWALAAASPVMLLQGLTQGFVGPGPALTVVNLLAGAAFLVFWIAGLRALSRKRHPA